MDGPGGVQSAPFYFYFTSTIFIVGRKMNFKKELLLTVRNLKKMRRLGEELRIKNEVQFIL